MEQTPQEDIPMKPNFANVLNLALIGILVVLVLGMWHPQTTPSVAAQTPTTQPTDSACDKSRSVSVSGAAVINVTPDRALIQLGVQTNGSTPDATRAENQQSIQKIISAMRALGIDAKDIATDHYIVYPIYENYDAMRIRGYRIDNTVSITLRKIDLADDAIISALKVGANEVQNVQFYTSELRKYRDEARALATKAASEKAQALATAAGSQTGCVVSISENIWSQYYGTWRGGKETTMWAQNVIQNAAPSAGSSQTQSDDSPISLGQIAVRAEVSVSYSLK
jgi:uncharacterized protein YggE